MNTNLESENLYSLIHDFPRVNRLFVVNGVNGDHKSLIKLFRKSGFNPKNGDTLISLGNFFGSESINSFADNEELSSIAHKDWCHLLLGVNEYWINQAYKAISSSDQDLLDLCVDRLGGWISDYLYVNKNKTIFSALTCASVFLSLTFNGEKIGFASNIPSYANWSSINGILSDEKVVNDLLFNPSSPSTPARKEIENIGHLYTTGPVTSVQRSYNCDVFPESNKNKMIYLLPNLRSA